MPAPNPDRRWRNSAMVRARRPHDSPLADSNVSGHCDRYGVTVASPSDPGPDPSGERSA